MTGPRTQHICEFKKNLTKICQIHDDPETLQLVSNPDLRHQSCTLNIHEFILYLVVLHTFQKFAFSGQDHDLKQKRAEKLETVKTACASNRTQLHPFER